MPQAFISGSAGIAAVVRGNLLEIFRHDETEIRSANIAGLSNYFADAYDVQSRIIDSEKTVRDALDLAWRNDRALRMLEIFLASLHDKNDHAEEAAECLLEFFSEEATRKFVEYRAYAIPLPESTKLIESSRVPKSLTGFINDLFTAQPAITKVRSDWNNLPDTYFPSHKAKSEFELLAIESGAFYLLARVATGNVTIDDALLSCYQAMRSQPGYRDILNSWTSDLRPQRRRHILVKQAEGLDEPSTEQVDAFNRAARPNVAKQQASIIEQLRRGNIVLARKFTGELIKAQIGSGSRHYAVLSLCLLAQEAHKLGQNSLQLEWLLEALEIDPSDGWAHGQAGDAYLSLYRYEEAKREFEAAGAFGDEQFSSSGRARLLMAQGQLRDALEIFRNSKIRFEGHKESARDWAGYADVLRELHEYDDALGTYDEAIEKFGEVPQLLFGRANVLADLGRLDEAIIEYRRLVIAVPTDVYFIMGLANALKSQGRFDDAYAVYDQGLQQVSESPFLKSARAGLLCDTHNFDAAISELSQLKDAHPHERAAWIGLAEALSQAGKANDAVEMYSEASERFSLEPRIKNGLARALRRAGRFHDALQQYDKNVADFPFDAASMTGRATLLKQLRYYNESLSAYDKITEKLPSYSAAKFGKASVLAIQGRYQEAADLLPIENPRTRSEWVGLHIRGMIALKQGNYSEAEQIFLRGHHHAPYFEQRSYFSNGLALAKLRKRDFQAAISFAKMGTGAASNIILLHSYLEQGQTDLAKHEYNYANDNETLPTVRELKDGLVSRYGLLPYGKPPSDGWIEEQEATILLQAA